MTKKQSDVAKRVMKSHDKYRDAGLTRAPVWCHPDETAELRELATELPKTKKILQKLGLI